MKKNKLKYPKDTWKYYGNAAHLCISNWCRFHLATLIGEYVISTVGEYYPPHATEKDCPKNPKPIGLTGIYETMIFKWAGTNCPCGCGLPEIDGSELECKRYETPKEATDGHNEFCERYAR